jgi:subtilisin family serine protease
LAVAPATSGAADGDTGAVPPAAADSIDGRVIVQWRQGAGHADKVAARDGADVDFRSDLGNRGFQLVEVEAGQTTADAIDALRDDPAVAVAERDDYSFPNAIPNDPLFGQLWGLRNEAAGIGGFVGALAGDDINAVTAWSHTVGSPSVVIADLDTGYRFDSPDLGPVAWANPGEIAANSIDDDGNGFVDDTRGYDFVGPSANSPTSDNDPTDDNLISGGHGVHTAGTMGAKGNNGVGITGVAQNVRIMPLRVCANVASTNEAGCPVSSQIAAINYAGANGARVANMSLGGTSFSEAEVNAFAENPQTLFVISAGNDAVNNESIPHYPCDYEPESQSFPVVPGAIDNIVCVAATNQADGLAGFSDWGAESVDLGAPGTETLSTFPVSNLEFAEDFEANDFGSTWSNSGSGFGRAGSGDGPLASFGMNDSPGAAPAASSVHQVTTTSGVSVPAGTGACILRGLRFRRPDSGSSFSYSVLSDDSPIFTNTTPTASPGSSMVSFNTVPITGLGGHSVKVSFGYTAGSAPTAENGIWLDDLELNCNAPLSTPPGYTLLQGTSMAAPHVTGAAGLLFSLEPAASVAEVRDALLAGVDPVASLAGKTVTGGRLDVDQAMAALAAPAAPLLTATNPLSPAESGSPKIVGSAQAGSTVHIFKGTSCSGAPAAAGTAAQLSSPGLTVSVAAGTTEQFTATAISASGFTSACASPIAFTNSTPASSGGGGGGGSSGGGATVIVTMPPGEATPPKTCTVPKLAGKTLGQAKSALAAAGCALGSVTKPKPKKGQKPPKLVVKSSSPGAGSSTTAAVNLKLGPKPKRRHH